MEKCKEMYQGNPGKSTSWSLGVAISRSLWELCQTLCHCGFSLLRSKRATWGPGEPGTALANGLGISIGNCSFFSFSMNKKKKSTQIKHEDHKTSETDTCGMWPHGLLVVFLHTEFQ